MSETSQSASARRLAAMEAQHKALQQQVAQLQDHLATQTQVHAEAQASLKAEVEALQSQLNGRQLLNERQRQDIETLQDQLDHQRLAIAQERRQWDHRAQQFQADLIEAQDVAQKRGDSVQRFKAELALARTHIAELQARLQQLEQVSSREQADWQEQQESLQARLAGYAETEMETAQRWQEERQALETALQHAQTSLQDRQLQAETLKTQLTTLQQQLTTLQSAQERLPELEAQANAYQHLQKEWVTAQDELQRLSKHQAQLTQQSQRREARLAELEAELRGWKEKAAEQQLHSLHLKAALERITEADTADILATNGFGTTKSDVNSSPPDDKRPGNNRPGPIDLPGFIRRP